MNLFVKTLLIIASILIFLSFAFIVIMRASDIEYGHHFTFKNELSIKIDSLEISVGNSKTIIYNLKGNIETPKSGFPCETIITVYSNGIIYPLKADSFNCYNCDGSHQYILRKEKAIYKFLN